MSRRGRVACGNKHKGMRRGAPHAPSPNLYNYSADAGAGSTTFEQAKQEGDANWRATLLGTVAAGALFFGYARTARAQVVPPAAPCDIISGGGTTVTCTGDVSSGVQIDQFGAAPDIFDTLNVNSLTQDIAPAAGVDGIEFTSNGSVTVNSDTINGPGGPFQILATGAGSTGIYARAYNGSAFVTSTGDITANGEGIDASSYNGITRVTSTGDITANLEGIYATATYGVRVTSTGDVTSVSRGGILVLSSASGVVTSTGDITASGDGIFVDTSYGAAITSTGDVISTNGAGLSAASFVGGAFVSSTGDITANQEGILAVGEDDVDVTSDGDIISTTEEGIRARSFDGSATVTSTGDITANDAGIFAQGELAVNVDSTGDITSASAAGIDARSTTGIVDVISTGDVTSRGTRGISAFSSNGAVNIISAGAITAGTDGIYAFSVNDSATVTSYGDVMTSGNTGIFAESINNGTATVTSTGNITAFNTGIFAASSQAVNVTSTGDLTSDIRDGIFARSFDGSTDVISDGNITADDNGIYARGDLVVNVTSTGDISSATERGINAFSDDYTVTVISTGNITAANDGIRGSAIQATSITSTGDVSSATGQGILGFSSSSSVTITTSGGTVSSALNAGVYARASGSNVTITNMADGTITGGAFAIVANSATGSVVNNFGTVTGNVIMIDGAGANAFNNEAGGIFNMLATVNLGAGNVLSNAGTLSPGGSGTVQTTAVRGNVVQSGVGTFAVDVDLTAATADQVNVNGSANLNGTVEVQVINPALLTQQFTILSAAGGTTNNGLGLGLTSPALQAELLYPNANDVVLSVSVDFSPSGLNSNQTSIGNNLNLALGAGSGSLGAVYDALLNGIFTLPDYIDALDQLSPEVYLNTDMATLFFAEEFSNNLFSCAKAGAGYSVMSEGQCLWVKPDGRLFDRDQTAENIGYEETSGGISAGAQVALAPNWYGGVAIGYERGSLDTDTKVESDSHRFAAGGVIKYQSGPVVLAAALSGGIADYDTERAISFGGFDATATSDHNVRYVGGQLRAAYLLDNGGWYAKPLVDVNVTHVDRDGVTETGGGAANLTIAGGSETFFSVTPAIELGTEFTHSSGGVVRPFVRAGVTFYEDDSHALSAGFAGAPGSVGNFRISTEFDDVFADLEAGVSAIYEDGSSLSFGYEGRLAENTQQHGFFVKGSVKY